MQVLRAPTPYVLPQRPRAEPKRLSDFITSVKKHEVREALIKPNVNKVLYVGEDDSLNQSNYVYTPELWKSLVDEEVSFDVDISTPFTLTDAFSTWFMIFLAFYFGRMLFSGGT